MLFELESVKSNPKSSKFILLSWLFCCENLLLSFDIKSKIFSLLVLLFCVFSKLKKSLKFSFSLTSLNSNGNNFKICSSICSMVLTSNIIKTFL